MYSASRKVSCKMRTLLKPVPNGQIAPKSNGSRLKSFLSVAPRTTRDGESPNALDRDRKARRALARLPTPTILRNIMLGVFFTSPILYKPGLAFLRAIAESESRILNPDRNPILSLLLKPLLYDHFCAGRNSVEIRQTKDRIKSIGYAGIVLCYGKELQISRSNDISSDQPTPLGPIEQWKNGNLETLGMIGSGDWLGMKMTGAGEEVTKALMHGRQLPEEFEDAMKLICDKAAAKGCRLWIDAESQIFQKSIDRLAITLMRRYNREGRVVVYNTLQAYLKASREKLKEHLALSSREGWSIAIKLVRGAYIETDRRDLIHDDKQSTDDCYNGIVHDLLSGSNLGFSDGEFPKGLQLMLAGHNPDSIGAASSLINSLSAQGKLKTIPEFAQLQGMGDVAGCHFLLKRQLVDTGGTKIFDGIIKPSMYKCLTWGSIQECMHYLFRRAVENGSATDRIKDDLRENWTELKSRIAARIGKR